MTVPLVVRCRGCGVPNSSDRADCVSCGTRLPAAPPPPAPGAAVNEGPNAAAAAPAPASSPEALRAAALASARVRGVVRVFLVLLGMSVVLYLAEQAGAPELAGDLVAGGAIAMLALVCAFAARAEILPLLARTGGWRGLAAATLGLALLVAFGAVYFPVFRGLGFPTLAITRPYVAAGWPRWSMFLMLSAAPALFEELTFRGYVMARLDSLLTAQETLLVQAALFSLMHLGVVIFPSHFVIGLVLGSVRRRTGSLYPGMAVHLGWNALCIWCELAGVQFP